VEVAISLPVILLLALGVTDIGRAFYYREAVTNATRQALRVAVSPSQHAAADAICAGTGTATAVTVTTSIPAGASSVSTIVSNAGLESSSNGTPAGSVISGATISITFHCLAGVAVTNATSNGAGPLDPGSDSVTVRITYTFSVITPLLWPVTGTSFPITVSSYQRSEY
jgi:Flp pilus assembly protein TadG